MYIPNMNNQVFPVSEAGALWAPRLRVARKVQVMHNWTYNLSAPFWRCYVPLSAGGFLHFQDQRVELKVGHGLIMPPETAAMGEVHRPFIKVFAHFSWEIYDLNAQAGLHVFKVPKELFQKVTKLQNGDPRSLALCMMEAILVGIQCLDALEDVVIRDPRVRQAQTLIEEHIADPLANATIAKALALHPNSFVRLFTAEHGCSPQRYGLRLRLRHAGNLLAETEQSLESIAEQCGFVDRHHLSRAFKKYWHVPPAEFRRQNRL